MNHLYIFILSGIIILSTLGMGCQSGDRSDTSPGDTTVVNETDPMQQRDTGTLEMIDITELDSGIVLDIRYATSNNFVERVMYDCSRCLLRKKVAQAVVNAHRELQKEHLGLKVFDCYRPHSVQKKMWSIVPDTSYVADPEEGSNHNRGIAVDLTIVDEEGEALAMGTPFDYFSLKAHHDYQNFSNDAVVENRRKLKRLMQRHGFEALETEWWHYTYSNIEAPIEDEMWDCPEK